MALALNGNFAVTPLLHEEKYNEQNLQISPDGRWLAYASNKTGRMEVCLRPYPDVESGREDQVSREDGFGPLWSPDSRKLFYRIGESVMAATVETKPNLKPGLPAKLLITKPYYYERLYNTMFPMWDISPKDKRFLMMKEEAPPSGLRKIIAVTNWFEELKQKAPSK